ESSITLDELQAKMRPSEAYARIAVVGEDIFMFYTDKQFATVYKPRISAKRLDQQVDQIRASISSYENGQYVTYAFDIESSHDLYKTLFSPLSERLTNIEHLVFEPDGAMLRLPINLLVMDDSS